MDLVCNPVDLFQGMYPIDDIRKKWDDPAADIHPGKFKDA